MTQLYCIYDLKDEPLAISPNSKDDAWSRAESIWMEEREQLIMDGYTCKPIQIANLEEEVVISKDDIQEIKTVLRDWEPDYISDDARDVLRKLWAIDTK